MSKIKNEVAWTLVNQIGRITNLLDLWADECLANGWNDCQINPMRSLARTIRAAMYDLTISEDSLGDIVTIAHAVASDALRCHALALGQPTPTKGSQTAQYLKQTAQKLEKAACFANQITSSA